MRLKLPRNFARWVIFGIAMFLAGFIIAQLLMPTSPGGPGGKLSPTGMGGGKAQPLEILENEETSYTPIIVAGVLMGMVVAYGYYRERKKKKV